ncbi:MAG TPA: glycosyl hydrolase family 28-related protein [Candidatus Acidoferrales bacterium]|nr:glycosyl hydrolase family 28-related protein [Candidatus Acidoferrales bacterium]
MRTRIWALLAATAIPALAASYYTVRLDDPKAVYLSRDGAADDSDAIQKAIDQVQETNGEGIVFVPEGRYRVTKTIVVWPAIRLIGYGKERPVFVLGENTPGYQDPDHENYMVFFAGGRRGATAGRPQDAGAGTFYSGMSNIDLEIQKGNPGAVGVRGKYAQHCFLAHMDFRTGSGLAGVHETGNVMEDVGFHGGRYGIWTGTPSPGWQFTAVDASFEGQREAAIRERAAGLTLIRPSFRHVPTAIEIEEKSHDELWVKDGRFEDISGPAVMVSLEDNPRTEINFEDAVCRRVPVFAAFRESGKKMAAPGEAYRVKTFSHGLSFADIGASPAIRDVFEAVPLTALPPPTASDLPGLPPCEGWVNIRSLGARGDGSTDDTDVFRKAVAGHRTIYVPAGKYILSDTVVLQPDTVLIGLHPSATQLILRDGTPAFQGTGAPKAMIEAPQGGSNILTGVGLYTNGINPRAVGAKWMAGAASMMNDVRFLGGHGTSRIEGGRENPYNNTHTADPDLNRRWDGQYPSLWVTDGGGGTFFDIWTPSTFAQAGMLVTDTATEGRVYQMSSEHHVRNEVQLRNVSNWRLYALQTEEERGEGGFALPLEIDHSSNVTIANFHIYRVISMFQPFPYAVKVSNSKDIRFRNIHCYSNSKVSFDSTIYDQTHGAEVRQREFAWLTLSGNAPAPARSSTVEKLAGGFYNISGGAVDPAGDFYFVDAHWQRIYKWSVEKRQLSTVRDAPLDPVNLAFDKAGDLLVVSYAGAGTVYTFRPGSPESEVTVLQPQGAAARPGMAPWLPAGDWRVNAQVLGQPYRQYVSPDGTAFIPAGQDFVSGAMSWGVKSSPLLRGFGLAAAAAGKRAYITSEAEITTYEATVTPEGGLSDMRVFANQGGEGVAVDGKGKVYIAAGQIWVYDPSGKLMETIEVPERPLQLVFGGKDRTTLFIPARSSLYCLRTK